MKSHVITDTDGRKNVIEPCMEPCSIERGMRVLGGKWKGSILWHLKDDPVRFNDLTRMVGGASKKMNKFKEYLDLKAKIVPAHFLNEAGIIGAAMAAKANLK